MARMGSNTMNMEDAIWFTCGGFSSTSKVAELEEFFKNNSYPKCHMKIKQLIEECKVNAGLADRLLNSDTANDDYWLQMLSRIQTTLSNINRN